MFILRKTGTCIHVSILVDGWMCLLLVLLHRYLTIHGSRNVKFKNIVFHTVVVRVVFIIIIIIIVIIIMCEA